MREDHALDLPNFARSQARLGLLADRPELGLRAFFAFCPSPRVGSLLRGLETYAPFWDLYLASRLGSPQARWAPDYYLQVNLSKLQPFYTTLSEGRRVHRTFSTGCILRLYRVVAKRDRRKTEKGPLSIRFFKRFFMRNLTRSSTTAVCIGYRRRYSFFLTSALLPFFRQFALSLVFTPQTLTGAFSFRRIKAIKKRIRKRLTTGNK